LESKLQKKVIADLKKKGWYVVKIVMCNVPGIPDALLMRDSKAVWVEFKDKGKKPEPLQLHRHKELRNHGFEVFVIDTWEQYIGIRF
jgi:hypothetical protein